MTKLRRGHMHLMNIGVKYWRATRAALSEAQRAACGYYLSHMDEFVPSGVGVFLHGDNGVGKSYLGSVMCKVAWGMYGYPSFCVTASELKEAWITDRPVYPEARQTVSERANDVRFLVIDDLGKEYRAGSGFAENRFGALIRSRVRDGKVTVITTNFSMKEFEGTYGRSTCELARESMHIINLVDVNHRSAEAYKLLKQVSKFQGVK